MAGRPPKPLKLLEISGAVSKNKKRYVDRGQDLKGNGPLGDPPGYWIERAQTSPEYQRRIEMWYELASQRPQDCPLTGSERTLLENAASLQCEIRYRWRKITAADHRQMQGYLRELGLTEYGRVGGKKQKADTEERSPWECFASASG